MHCMDVTYRYMGISHSLKDDKERPFFVSSICQSPKALEGENKSIHYETLSTSYFDCTASFLCLY